MVRVLALALASTVKSDEAGAGLYGCGLLGALPEVTPEVQSFIDGLKSTSSYGKVSYWNWDLKPHSEDILTSDFTFLPENWGNVAVEADALPAALEPSPGSTALMGDIFLGANEPDITGSCMGGMMGKCTAPCTQADWDAGDCPACDPDAKQGSQEPNSGGRCSCPSATSSGFWSVPGCTKEQPMPELFGDEQCVDVIMDFNAKNGALAKAKGYKYFSAPLLAVNMDYMKQFVRKACANCSEIDCGCPSHVGWHFYANDCRPKSTGGYADFQKKLDATVELMEEFRHLKGAIVNEVGMLDCDMPTPTSACIPGNGKYPALDQPGHTCPVNDELPNGMASFVETLIAMAANATTKDGRAAVAGFTWFSENMDGATYDLRLFDDSGKPNAVGQAYVEQCQAWASGRLATPRPSMLV